MPQSFRCNWAAPVRMTLAFAALAVFAPMPLRAAVPVARCITVKDVVIVSGTEAWADKKLCKSPGSARYDVIEVAQTVYGAASTTAAFEKASNPELRALRSQIEQLRAQVASAGDEANAARLALLSAQGRFVTLLAGNDRGYAEAIAQFRTSVADIAASPEGVAALAQYNAGDEVGALAVLDRLRAANDAARLTQSNIASASEARRIAGLALDARGRGKLGTAAVIARYEDVTRLDPGLFGDWINLIRLYEDAGRLADAERTVRRARETASGKLELERWLALLEHGLILSRQGDLARADTAYAESLAIARRLSAAYPGNLQVQRLVLSVSLDRIGGLRVGQGDLAGAETAFAESLAIDRKFAAADPENVRAQRDVSVSLGKIGDLRVKQGYLIYADEAYAESLATARKLAADPNDLEAQRFVAAGLHRIGDLRMTQDNFARADQAFAESLVVLRKLAAIDPSNALAQRGVSLSLARIGNMRVAQGDLARADTAFVESVSIARKLASADHGNSEAQRDLAVSLGKVGDLRLKQGDLARADAAYTESLGILRKLAAADPSNAQAQTDAWASLSTFAGRPGSGIHWRDVVTQMEAMAAKGKLAQVDRPLLERARANAAREGGE